MNRRLIAVAIAVATLLTFASCHDDSYEGAEGIPSLDVLHRVALTGNDKPLVDNGYEFFDYYNASPLTPAYGKFLGEQWQATVIVDASSHTASFYDKWSQTDPYPYSDVAKRFGTLFAEERLVVKGEVRSFAATIYDTDSTKRTYASREAFHTAVEAYFASPDSLLYSPKTISFNIGTDSVSLSLELARHLANSGATQSSIAITAIMPDTTTSQQ